MFKIFKTIDKELYSSIPKFYFILVLVTIFEFLSVFIMIPISQIFFKKKIEVNFFLTDYLNNLDYNQLVYYSLISLVILYLIKNKLVLYFSWWKINFVNKFEEKISYRLMKKYLSKEFTFFQNYSVGNFNNYLSVEISHFSTSLLNILQLISEVVIFISIAGLLVFHQTKITIFLVILILFTALISGFFLKKYSVKFGEIWVKTSNKINDFAIQCFNSIIEIKIYSKLNFFSDIFNNYKKKNLIAKRNSTMIGEVPRPIFEFILIISFVILIYYLIETGKSEMLPEIMALFLAGSYRLIPGISRCSTLYQSLKKNKYLIDNMIDDLRISKDTVDSKKKNICFDKSIDLKNVYFSFKDKGENKIKIFEEFNFSIKKGELIAIVGKSGCGKTTLLNLILGFIQPGKGHILSDNNQSISDNLTNWLEKISYVPQSPVIIEDTIKTNITLEHDNIDQNQLDDAILKACLNEDIKKFSNGIETNLGTKGVFLSGGQKQRISLARAFYKNSELIILDEPTSSLDSFTEKKIIENLITTTKKTIIMVTHKTNLIEKFDKIIKL